MYLPASSDELWSNARESAEEPVTECGSIESVYYPTTGQNENNIDVFIVNTETFKQGISIEKCTNSREPCLFNTYLPFGYHNECTQKFGHFVLSTLTPDGNGIVKEKIKFPINCSCEIFRD